MAKSLEEWKRRVFNTRVDLDNQSYDCVDVSKSWIEYLSDKPWTTSAGWGNAKDIYDYWSDAFLQKMPAGTAPALGDIFCMNGTIGGGYGHTGVVVGINGGNITVYQQDTFKQVPIYTGIWNGGGSYIRYLRPKVAFTIGDAPALAPNQRIASYAAKYRSAPSGSAQLIKEFTAGDTYDFKGFVVGETVDGNPNWFVGQYTGGYVWSGAFTDSSTNGLPNITPAAIGRNQRQVGADVMNVRREPVLAPDNVITTLEAGKVYTFTNWQRGADVEGNTTWFKLDTGGYVHSSGFTDTSTHDLTELVVATVPTTPPKPKYAFIKDLACVTEVDPAGEGNFEYGNFPAKPTKVVLHDFGTEGRDTFGSTRNSFNKDGYEVSAHFVVSGKMILQMVSLKDRAWHAGKNGNDFVGIEIDPAMDKDTINSVITLRKQLDDFYGYKLIPIEHNQIMATNCGDDVVLEDLDPYKVTPLPVDPKPTDPKDPVVVPPSTPDVEVIPAERPYNIGAIAIRVFSTFYQAFIGVISAALLTGIPLDKSGILALIGAAVAAGVSAVKNVVVKPQEVK